MTKDELITRQQLEIGGLKDLQNEYEEDRELIRNMLFCIGGPLNDNFLKFNKDQRTVLHRINEHCDTLRLIDNE